MATPKAFCLIAQRWLRFLQPTLGTGAKSIYPSMRTARVKLFYEDCPCQALKASLVVVLAFKWHPSPSLLLFRFYKAQKSPPIGHGAFLGRSKRKTDQAGTVTNVFCLALFLLGPTFLISVAHIQCLMFPSSLACSLLIPRSHGPFGRTFYTCPMRRIGSQNAFFAQQGQHLANFMRCPICKSVVNNQGL
jgi:hypothetical protein